MVVWLIVLRHEVNFANGSRAANDHAQTSYHRTMVMPQDSVGVDDGIRSRSDFSGG